MMSMMRLVVGLLAASRCVESFYVCSVGDPRFIGKYAEDSSQTSDGAQRYVNDGGMSIYRHQGYWYFGDTAPWPPVTHFRCIEGCGYNLPTPPMSGYLAKKNIGVMPAPTLQTEPCAVNEEL
jgi:hypothetical protein